MTNPDSSPPHRLRYIPALDGIRAVAIAMVVLFNLRVPHAWAGFTGVRIFFVLSGFLITALLLEGHLSEREHGLRDFYLRRFRRLFPPLLFAVCIYFMAMVATRGWGAAELAYYEAIFGLSYFSNWTMIYLGIPSDLGHTWSLAAEEQFYFLWPLLLMIAWRVGRLRGLAILVVATLGLAALARALTVDTLMSAPRGQLRVYLGTDTSISGFIIGAGVACLLYATRTREALYSGAARALALPVALASLFALQYFARSLDLMSPWTYKWGLPGAEVATATLILSVLAAPRGVVSRVLGSAPLVWLGRISYSLYLWHAIIPAIWPPNHPHDTWAYSNLAYVGASVGVAAMAYLLVERRLLRQSRLRGIYERSDGAG